jgi:peptide/nickel transport system permease protein
MVDSVIKRDVPAVQACGVIFGALYVGLNLLADLVAIAANPRLRYPR